MTGKVIGVLAQKHRCRKRYRLRGLPCRRVQPHHIVHATQCMQCSPRTAKSPWIEAPELCIPRDKASHAAQGQLCTFIQFASCTIDAEALDPLQVNAGAAVLHGAIGAPDPEHIFGAWWSRDGVLSGLMFHRTWFP